MVVIQLFFFIIFFYFFGKTHPDELYTPQLENGIVFLPVSYGMVLQFFSGVSPPYMLQTRTADLNDTFQSAAQHAVFAWGL